MPVARNRRLVWTLDRPDSVALAPNGSTLEAALIDLAITSHLSIPEFSESWAIRMFPGGIPGGDDLSITSLQISFESSIF